jgi:hypothetical protein
MKLIIQLVLWVLIAFLAWQLYSSIIGPVKFNEKRDARYAQVIKNLKDIRSAELAYKELNGKFTGSYDSLVRFIDTAQFAIIQRRDTFYADEKRNEAFGLDKLTGGYILEETILDTLDFTPIKDSLFGGTDRYKTMMKVPIEGVDAEFTLKTGTVVKNDAPYSAFEAKVAKDVILSDLDKDLLSQEKMVVSVEGVNGAYIKVGSLETVDTSGNWPKIYDATKQN